MPTDIHDVVIVGAGLAGLTAARELARQGRRPLILEKSRGVGGRLATRRWKGATLDHGCPALPDGIANAYESLMRPWPAGEALVGPRAWVPAGGMTAFPKHLADGIEIRGNTLLTGLDYSDGQWLLTTETSSVIAHRVIMTAPLPQSLNLLRDVPGGPAVARDLSPVLYRPQVTLLCLGEDVWPGPAVDRLQGHWIVDNHRKGVSRHPALTVHLSAQTSSALAGQTRQSLHKSALAHLPQEVASWAAATTVHLWRYARCYRPLSRPCAWIPGRPSLVLAGDAFAGGDLQGAVTSGMQAARQLKDVSDAPIQT